MDINWREGFIMNSRVLWGSFDPDEILSSEFTQGCVFVYVCVFMGVNVCLQIVDGKFL